MCRRSQNPSSSTKLRLMVKDSVWGFTQTHNLVARLRGRVNISKRACHLMRWDREQYPACGVTAEIKGSDV